MAMQKISQKWLLVLAAIFLVNVSHLQAQNWFEDDEEETVAEEGEAWDVPAGNFPEVRLRLDGQEAAIQEAYSFSKGDTLSIQVRHAKPGSAIVLHVKKGGIKLKRTAFYANEKGQLDLEVRTGNRKIKGSATVFYTPSNGKKKERDVKISIE